MTDTTRPADAGSTPRKPLVWEYERLKRAYSQELYEYAAKNVSDSDTTDAAAAERALDALVLPVLEAADAGTTQTPQEAIMRAVMVTTDKRGVFAGLLEQDDGQAVTLTEARMCVYWSADVRGVVGLAARGPSDTCRVTPAAPRIELRGVTAVFDLTPKALEAWRREPWG
jgi:hypothetical protein